MKKSILVTGGCGFIGSNFIRHWLETEQTQVINLDLLTYAGNVASLFEVNEDERYHFVQGDIGNATLVSELLAKHQPSAIINFAAESHVDRSILSAERFVQTNILGTFNLLEATRAYWNSLSNEEQLNFRFLHVSTDEVYGTLTASDPAFTETTPYAPNSPYSASKAASDHLVRAWHETYKLPTLTTNCSNNYGPAQFPEKLIPLMILNALQGEKLPIYGDGQNIRDWLFVKDHCQAIRLALQSGRLGETYCVGGKAELTNKYVVETICEKLDHLCPRQDSQSYKNQIAFVQDRLGHDRRYAIDITKIENELGWTPSVTFDEGLALTIQWYLANQDWVKTIQDGSYRQWISQNYKTRAVA